MNFEEGSRCEKQGLVWDVSLEAEAMRIDTWIRQCRPWISRHSIQKALRRGFIRIDGEKVAANTRLVVGQKIYISSFWDSLFPRPDPPSAPSPIADALPIWKDRLEQWIFYEDDHLLALNKPKGIACQGGSGQLIHLDGLLACRGVKSSNKVRAHRLVHRLDKETSGVLIVAKTLRCAQSLTKAFHDRAIKKTYWAIVHGHLPKKGTLNHSMHKQEQRMVICSPDAPGALWAATRYSCLFSWKDPLTHQPFSLAELSPTTGRTHQLRLHLQSIGHPILGDSLYGGGRAEGLFLHCCKMAFTYNQQPYTLDADLPGMFKRLLSTNRRQVEEER